MKTNSPYNIRYTHKYTQAIATFALTGLVCLGGSLTSIQSAVAGSIIEVSQENIHIDHQSELNTLSQQIRTGVTENSLPRSVRTAVLRDISRRDQIPMRKLEVISATPRTWRNGCLELSRRGELCTQALVSGWRVVVSDRTAARNWVYHTNGNGRVLRRASDLVQNPVGDNLPASVRNAVLKAASRRLNVSANQLIIMRSQQRQWRNGCLEISAPGHVCTQAIVPGWQVVVGAREQTLVYHTDSQGRLVVLNIAESTIAVQDNDLNLSKTARDRILTLAAKIIEQPKADLKILSHNLIPTSNSLQVTIGSEKAPFINRWVFIENQEKQLTLSQRFRETRNTQLPTNIRTTLLNQAARQSGVAVNQVKIEDVIFRQYPDACNGIINPGRVCATVITSEWEVKIRTPRQTLVYAINENGNIALR